MKKTENNDAESVFVGMTFLSILGPMLFYAIFSRFFLGDLKYLAFIFTMSGCALWLLTAIISIVIVVKQYKKNKNSSTTKNEIL